MSVTAIAIQESRKSWRDYLTVALPLQGRITLTVILLVGFVLRVWWMVSEAPVISSDGAEYARMAEHLFYDHALVGNFEGPEIIYGPLYPFLIAGTMLVVRNSETAAHIVSLISGVALIATVFLLALHVYGRRTAYVCALLVSVHPLLVALSGSVYNEALYLTVLMALVYCGVRALDLQGRRDYLLLGICLGLAYLTRVEAFAYVLFFVAALLTAGLLRRMARAAVIGSIIAVAVFFALASPYVAFLYNHTGTLRLEAKWDMNYTMARNRLAGMSDTEAEYAVDKDGEVKGPMLAPAGFTDGTPYPHTLMDRLRTLASMAKYHKGVLYRFFNLSRIGSPVLLTLVVLGLVRQSWSKRRVGHEVVLLTMTGSVAFFVLASAAGEFRYFLPIVPLLLIWAGKGIDELRLWIMGWELLRDGRSSGAGIIAGGLQVCALVSMIMLSIHGIRKESLFVDEHSSAALAERDAAVWLAHYDPRPKRIAVRFAVVPYYAKGTLIGLPYGDPEATTRYLAAKNVDFVVLESGYAQELPAVGEWVAHGIRDARAQLIYDRTNSNGDRVIIYRWQARTDDGNVSLGSHPGGDVPSRAL